MLDCLETDRLVSLWKMDNQDYLKGWILCLRIMMSLSVIQQKRKAVADAVVSVLEKEIIRCWYAPWDILMKTDWSLK